MSEQEKDHRKDVSGESTDGTSRRDFIEKNLKRSALLPYVAPVIHTIFLPTDANAASAITNSTRTPHRQPTHPLSSRV